MLQVKNRVAVLRLSKIIKISKQKCINFPNLTFQRDLWKDNIFFVIGEAPEGIDPDMIYVSLECSIGEILPQKVLLRESSVFYSKVLFANLSIFEKGEFSHGSKFVKVRSLPPYPLDYLEKNSWSSTELRRLAIAP